MLGGLGNLAGLMKSAKEMQDNLKKLQDEMAKRRFEGVAGGDAVRATVDGKGTLVDIRIDPKALSDVELLEDLIKAAIGAATTKSQDQMKQEMNSLAGGLDLGQLSKMLGGD
ncbi:MAG: YbaB/EbfC family nucleoid-associated protein [Planctomycetes bacterium]|nr:YbaB/EbfC family nucleoid-associated protein [Planctomycetota bacterium]